MAMLPSPTAAATRLTGLRRTSPHANTPGTVGCIRHPTGRVPRVVAPRAEPRLVLLRGKSGPAEREQRRDVNRAGGNAHDDDGTGNPEDGGRSRAASRNRPRQPA